MKTRNVPESWKRQWSKFMYCFFDYLPVKYEANEREWKVRKMIWDFKDGKRSLAVAELIAKKIREQFGAECENNQACELPTGLVGAHYCACTSLRYAAGSAPRLFSIRPLYQSMKFTTPNS